jgi:TRAP-type C4-dicarboxylate transport system substrate-binding protein
MKRVTGYTVLAVVAFTFLGVTTVLGQGAPITLRLAHINVAGGIIDKQAQKFADLVAAKTNGRVKINVYPAGQLGSVVEEIEGVSMGTIDMVLESDSFMQIFEKDYNIFGVPFLLTRDEIIKSPFLAELRERARVSRGVRTLPGSGFRPPHQLWTQKRAVRVPEDLQGMKIRLWQQKIQIDMWNGLGASAVPIAWGELYMALAQGVVNGMVHNIVQVEEEKFYEQLNYCTLLNLLEVWQNVLVNEKVYAKLPPDIQNAMSQAATEAGAYFTNLAASAEGESKKRLEKAGIKFINGDRSAWVKKALPIARKLEDEGMWSKGLLKKFGYE